MEKIQNDTVLFRFVPGKRMFWADYRGNRQSIERLQTLIREHKDAIFSGSEKVRVLGFCSSYGSVKENLAVAKNRSNQVKSYYIVHEGLKEEHFYTTNSASAWNGDSEIVAIAFMVESVQVEDSLEDKDAVESGVAAGEAGVETPAGPEAALACSQVSYGRPCAGRFLWNGFYFSKRSSGVTSIRKWVESCFVPSDRLSNTMRMLSVSYTRSSALWACSESAGHRASSPHFSNWALRISAKLLFASVSFEGETTMSLVCALPDTAGLVL